MKLTYPTQPTETMQIVTPLGTQHAIPIWIPIGKRSEPVMVESQPQLYDRFVMDSKVRGQVIGMLPLVVEYMHQHPGGRTTWDIMKALRQLRGTINGVLVRNPDLFYCDDVPVKVDFISRDGRRCSTVLKLWHLRKDKE